MVHFSPGKVLFMLKFIIILLLCSQKPKQFLALQIKMLSSCSPIILIIKTRSLCARVFPLVVTISQLNQWLYFCTFFVSDWTWRNLAQDILPLLRSIVLRQVAAGNGRSNSVVLRSFTPSASKVYNASNQFLAACWSQSRWKNVRREMVLWTTEFSTCLMNLQLSDCDTLIFE